ncbi:MAG: nucleotidyltransferase domain-containing protein [Oscillospiraceae bacterium]|nr:nucleotidyltransferase domain-containing protein [Oscillospiraceae bacterium]
MIDIGEWSKNYLAALGKTFGERVWFVGLQGSRSRGEATETSDIDVVAVLDELSDADIRTYGEILDTLPHRELICGFISGKSELLNWESSDLFQFYNDTKPLKGSLDELLPLLDAESVNRAIKIGLCNIYHGCVHNMLHEKSIEILTGLYKTACFTIQAIRFAQTGKYISRLSDLLVALDSENGEIVQVFIALKNGQNADFDTMSEKLFNWARAFLVNPQGCNPSAL